MTGVSPGQLLMGRRLRTTLPMIPSQLQPQLVDDNLIRHPHDLCKRKKHNITIKDMGLVCCLIRGR